MKLLKNMGKILKERKGFSLVELIICIFLVLILIGIVFGVKSCLR